MNRLKTLVDLYRLKRKESLSVAQMKELQNQKLRALLHTAWNHSSYYRRIFSEAGIREEQLDELPLSEFPSLDKKELLAHFDELVTESGLKQEKIREFDELEQADRKPYRGKYHVVHSSGSTGKPGYFVYDESAWKSMILGMIRAALWGMSMPKIIRLLIRQPRIVYIAATDGRYGGAMAVGDGIDCAGSSQLNLDVNSPIKDWIRRLREFKPNIVIGYPSAIKILAQLIEKGKVRVDAEKVISCGEPLGAGLRAYLEHVFHVQVINFYGASESLALGVEMNPEEGMILFDDMNIIEVENDNMYLTCLYNYVQPLIRYRLTDSMALKKPKEGDACPFTRAVGLLGRKEDILWFQDDRGREEFLHPLSVEGICIEGLKDYQFRQTGRDSLVMYVEMAEEEEYAEDSEEKGCVEIFEEEEYAENSEKEGCVEIFEEKGYAEDSEEEGYIDIFEEKEYAEDSDGNRFVKIYKEKSLTVQNHAERKIEIREKIVNQMYKILEEKNLNYVRFHVVFVKEILPDAVTGKKTLIIRGEDGYSNENIKGNFGENSNENFEGNFNGSFEGSSRENFEGNFNGSLEGSSRKNFEGNIENSFKENIKEGYIAAG